MQGYLTELEGIKEKKNCFTNVMFSLRHKINKNVEAINGSSFSLGSEKLFI